MKISDEKTESCSSSESSCSSELQSGRWIIGKVETSSGDMPEVSTSISVLDRLGWWARRWGIGRSSFAVPPGLYAVGSPGAESAVFVSANYKMSFDHLRKDLSGRDGWILVLDTKGINVWCAAGKGTFGTEELVRRIHETKLEEIVNHRSLILPQLSAPGVSAHAVKKESGFRVTYGPVRSADLPAWLDAGQQASPEMRRVQFGFVDRLVLVPMELVGSFKYLFITAVILFLASGIVGASFSVERAMGIGSKAVLMIAAAWIAGSVLGPVFLPYLPGSSFSARGIISGLVMILLLWMAGIGLPTTTAEMCTWILAVSSISSFIVMNFTGASTFTSPSGVRHEMKVFVPMQAAGAVLAAIAWVVHLVML